MFLFLHSKKICKGQKCGATNRIFWHTYCNYVFAQFYPPKDWDDTIECSFICSHAAAFSRQTKTCLSRALLFLSGKYSGKHNDCIEAGESVIGKRTLVRKTDDDAATKEKEKRMVSTSSRKEEEQSRGVEGLINLAPPTPPFPKKVGSQTLQFWKREGEKNGKTDEHRTSFFGWGPGFFDQYSYTHSFWEMFFLSFFIVKLEKFTTRYEGPRQKLSKNLPIVVFRRAYSSLGLKDGEGGGAGAINGVCLWEKSLSDGAGHKKNRVLKQKMVYWAPPWLRPSELGRGQKWSLFSFTAQRRKTLIFEESEIRLNSSFFPDLEFSNFFRRRKNRRRLNMAHTKCLRFFLWRYFSCRFSLF